MNQLNNERGFVLFMTLLFSHVYSLLRSLSELPWFISDANVNVFLSAVSVLVASCVSFAGASNKTKWLQSFTGKYFCMSEIDEHEARSTFEVQCISQWAHSEKDMRGGDISQTKIAVYFSYPATKAMDTRTYLHNISARQPERSVHLRWSCSITLCHMSWCFSADQRAN